MAQVQTNIDAPTSPSGARPRLLVLTPDFPPNLGGIQLLVVRLVERMPAFDVRVVAPAAARHQDVSLGCEVVRPPQTTLRLKGIARTAALNAFAVGVAATFRPHLVLNMHIATAPASGYPGAVRAVRLRGRASAPAGVGAPGAQSRATGDWDQFHAVELAVRYGANPIRTALIPPGVDGRPALAPADIPRPPHIVAVARLADRYKGHDVLIRAMPLVRAAVPEARLRIIGDGRLRAELERLALQVGGADVIDFLGSVADDVRDRELSNSLVFALPARLPPDGSGEGFGIVFLEAGMACLPVVAVAPLERRTQSSTVRPASCWTNRRTTSLWPTR